MDFFDSTYFNLIKTLTSVVGIWPYQEPRTRILRTIICYGLCFLMLSSMFAKMFTMKYNVDDIVDVLSFLIPGLCYLYGYITFHYHLGKLKMFFDFIKSDWAMLENSEEIDIIKKYTIKSKNISIVLTVIFYGFVLLTIFDFKLPVLLDKVLPLNETRERKFLIPIETFVKLEDTTIGLICISLILVLTGIIALAVYCCFLLGIYHTCGMFSITGYENFLIFKKVCFNHRHIELTAYRLSILLVFLYILDHSFDEKDQYICSDKYYEIIRRKIIRTIEFHIRAIKFFEHLKDMTEVCYSVQITLAMVVMGAQYVKMMLITKETLMKNLSHNISFVLEVVGVLFSVFINCHAGQEVINHSIDVSNKAADAPWYLASKNTQALAILILMRGQTPCFVGVGKTFVSSYEFFVSLLKTSVSYATVCYTMK